MKKLFTIILVSICLVNAKAAVGDTIYFENFEKDKITQTVFQYNADWSSWNGAFIVDSVKLNGSKSMLIPAGLGTWGEFVGKVPTWTFKANNYYKITFRVKCDSARSLDVTRLSEGSVLFHKTAEIDAFDNNGEWVCQLNSDKTLVKYEKGKWLEIVTYLLIGTGTPNATGPTFGFGWGGNTPLYLDDILVQVSSEDQKNAETTWVKEVTGTTSSVARIQNISNAKLYPNPAKGQVEVLSSSVVNKIDVYSINGALVKSFVASNLKSFNTNGMASGLYSVAIQGNNYRTNVKLVVK